MDQRTTLNNNEKFDELLRRLEASGETARLLFDEGGIQRAEGKISILHLQDKRAYLVLEDGTRVYTDSIIGLNAVFRDDYTEC